MVLKKSYIKEENRLETLFTIHGTQHYIINFSFKLIAFEASKLSSKFQNKLQRNKYYTKPKYCCHHKNIESSFKRLTTSNTQHRLTSFSFNLTLTYVCRYPSRLTREWKIGRRRKNVKDTESTCLSMVFYILNGYD